MEMEPWAESLQKKLDEHYVWPALYTFKFIVPRDKVADVKQLFPLHESREKPSKNGNYVSVTLQMMAPGSEEIIAVYRRASAIEGLIAL